MLQAIDVPLFSNLSTLSLWAPFPCYGADFPFAWEFIRSLFTSFPSSIRKLHFRPRLCSRSHTTFAQFLESQDTSSVENSIIEVSNLKVVEVVVLDQPLDTCRELEDRLSRVFSSLADRGLLHFASPKDPTVEQWWPPTNHGARKCVLYS